MEKLKFLGIGGATNVELGSNSSFLKIDDSLLLIDVCESATEKLVSNNILEGIKNVYITITHTHFDHVAGIGVLIWYLNFELNIKPNIITNDKFITSIKKLFQITGVDYDLVNFIKDDEFKMDDLTLTLIPTAHSTSLDCYGIMFKDSNGLYYYTGDTKDINFIEKCVNDDNVKTIYTEVSEFTYDVHIAYSDLLKIKSDKLILMHFGSMKIYEQAKKDGFNIANLI